MPNTLTIATACYKSFHSLYFTLLDLRKSHGWGFDLLVIDNAPESCAQTRAITASCRGTYVHRPDLNGTTRPRNACFHYAKTPWVMVLDDHVLLDNGAVTAAIRYADQNPKSKDIISGPILGDDSRWVATQWTSKHSHDLWGVWGCDADFQSKWGNHNAPDWDYFQARKAVDLMPPFEIRSMGLGLWMMRKDAWPDFNPHFRGFGGEEGYIHAKVRQLGGRALCHPSIRWHHKFRDIAGAPGNEVPYPLRLEDHVRNLLLGARELGVDCVDDIWEEYGKKLNGGRDTFDSIRSNVDSVQQFGVLYTPKKLKVLGVWYTNNSAPAKLLHSSLDTIRVARDASRHDVVVATSSWSKLPNHPFPSCFASEDTKKLPGHHAIVRQIRDAWRTAENTRGGGWHPDLVCFLEHDVLYPPGYFDRMGNALEANPVAEVISHQDCIGLNATGWLKTVRQDSPLHQLAVTAARAKDNLDRAELDCGRQGWAYLEPDHAADRSKWVYLKPEGFSPSVHVNW